MNKFMQKVAGKVGQREEANKHSNPYYVLVVNEVNTRPLPLTIAEGCEESIQWLKDWINSHDEEYVNNFLAFQKLPECMLKFF